MKRKLPYYLILYFFIISHSIFAQVKIGEDIISTQTRDWFSESISMNDEGSILVVGASQNYGGGGSRGQVRVFKLIDESWQQLGLSINGDSVKDNSGNPVAISGDGSIIAIGAENNDANGENAGHVRVYQFLNNEWKQLGKGIVGQVEGDHFGSSIALNNDGKILAVGSRNGGLASGRVRVYKFIDNNWNQLGGEIVEQTATDRFGTSLDLSSDGQTLAIGAPDHNGIGFKNGQVQVFSFINGTWAQSGLNINGKVRWDRMGQEVCISKNGKVLAMRSLRYDQVGGDGVLIEVYEKRFGNWKKVGNDVSSRSSDKYKGGSMTLSGDGKVLAMGVIIDDTLNKSAGLVQVYEKVNRQWVKIGKEMTGVETNEMFGFKLSLNQDGRILSVGALALETEHQLAKVRVYRIALTGDEVLNASSITNEGTTVQIYPNPVIGDMNLSFSSEAPRCVKVFDTFGRMIMKVDKTAKQFKIDLSELPSSQYIIEIQDDHGVMRKMVFKH